MATSIFYAGPSSWSFCRARPGPSGPSTRAASCASSSSHRPVVAGGCARWTMSRRRTGGWRLSWAPRGLRATMSGFCPHHPQTRAFQGRCRRSRVLDCECRKPEPGVVLDLAARLTSIFPGLSWSAIRGATSMTARTLASLGARQERNAGDEAGIRGRAGPDSGRPRRGGFCDTRWRTLNGTVPAFRYRSAVRRYQA